MKTFTPKEQAFQDNYKLLIGSIVPRPIAVISTRNLDGSNNLAPFSFFTAISASPMIIAFCPLIRVSTGGKKDTVINIEREKEFVLNFCTEDISAKVNQASAELPYGEDEFLFSGFTPLDSTHVKAKRVKESPIQFECILRDILSYGEDVGSGRLITGEVIKAHVDQEILDEGRILTQKYRPVGRGAGNDWFRCTDVFEYQRLMGAQIQR